MLAALYPSKKALKESIAKPLQFEETSFFGPEYKDDGKFAVVGPSPTNRKWYAEVTMSAGIIAKVK